MKYLIPVIPLVAAIGVAAAQAPTPALPAPSVLLGGGPSPDAARVSDSALPSFEVASVKSNKNGPTSPMMARMLPTRFEATNMPLRFLIQQAYRLPPYQMHGGPAWIDSERFDIVAKPPDGSAQDQIALMIRSLLIERFKLVAHRETKEAPIYALVMARSDGKLGQNLSKTTDDCEAILKERRAAARARGPGPVPFTPPGPNERAICTINTMPVSREPGAPFLLRMRAGGQTMEALARTLSPFVSRPVVDRTGLTGLYDYEFEYSPIRTFNVAPLTAAPSGAPATAPIDDGPTIFESVQQLGLKLESTKGPVEFLIIDSAAKPIED